MPIDPLIVTHHHHCSLEHEPSKETELGSERSDDDTLDLSSSAIRHYFATRISSLKELHLKHLSDINPIPALREMSSHNWNFFFMGMLAWFSASFDFFLTSVSGTYIAETLNVTTADITWGLSAVLMVRSVGAVIFGLWTDKYSRKWPFITTAAMFLVLQIGTGFCKTYQQFLAVRALSGIAMGGTYATAAATSLDDSPVKARSFLSGLFFSSYAWGMVFAAIFWKAFSGTEKTWKSLFWFSSGFPAILIIWRLVTPETLYFQRVLSARKLIKEEMVEKGLYHKETMKERLQDMKLTMKKYWILFIYLILLLAGSNFLAHSSQDMFPTMLRKQLEFSEDAITVAIVITNLGGVVGSILIGVIQEVLGRRLSIILCCILGGAITYPAMMIQTNSAVLGACFFFFFSVLGVWGVIPAHLSELSPPDARVLVSGLAYQLGNLASSASSTIETRLAKNWPLEFNSEGVAIKLDYAKTIACFTGAVFVYTLIMTLLGPEKFHRDLSSPLMKKYIEKVERALDEKKENGEHSFSSREFV
uniref:MFS transporter n=1 Tax=Cyberlindnera americana TaxID=36016 RepID=A0A5P8N8H1_9ASCO|nr:MFS transporter [Cyberlindnera americana]